MYPPCLELSELFRRDLRLLKKYLEEFSQEEKLFSSIPGNKNSAGHLTQHLIGNLSQFIVHVLGQIPYERNREAEFGTVVFSRPEMIQIISELIEKVPEIVQSLPKELLEKNYPIQVFQKEMSTHYFLIHLYGHFNLHLGQIRYITRYWDAIPN